MLCIYVVFALSCMLQMGRTFVDDYFDGIKLLCETGAGGGGPLCAAADVCVLVLGPHTCMHLCAYALQE